MKLFRAICIAITTYTRLPAPQVEWSEESRREAMRIFPSIGFIIGVVLSFWLVFCERFEISSLLKGAVGTAIPLMITGGIHMDGFMDTADAMASWKSREERLEILKDSHVGAFAVIHCCLYLLVMAGLLSEAKPEDSLPFLGCFMLSRAASTLALTRLKHARKKSMLTDFEDEKQKQSVTWSCLLWIILSAVLLLEAGLPGWMTMLGAGICFAWYRHRAYKHFGGVTGDLAGWYLQVTELTCLACLILTRCMIRGV